MTRGRSIFSSADRHGHVLPREDGSKARCGGPAICRQCREEAAVMGLDGKPSTPGRIDVNGAEVDPDFDWGALAELRKGGTY